MTDYQDDVLWSSLWVLATSSSDYVCILVYYVYHLSEHFNDDFLHNFSFVCHYAILAEWLNIYRQITAVEITHITIGRLSTKVNETTPHNRYKLLTMNSIVLKYPTLSGPEVRQPLLNIVVHQPG